MPKIWTLSLPPIPPRGQALCILPDRENSKNHEVDRNLIVFINRHPICRTDSWQAAFISLEIKEKPISEVIEQIEKQTDYNFFYNSRLIDMQRRVSVQVDNEDVFVVLNEIFGNSGVQYKVVDNDILLPCWIHPLLPHRNRAGGSQVLFSTSPASLLSERTLW